MDGGHDVPGIPTQGAAAVSLPSTTAAGTKRPREETPHAHGDDRKQQQILPGDQQPIIMSNRSDREMNGVRDSSPAAKRHQCATPSIATTEKAAAAGGPSFLVETTDTSTRGKVASTPMAQNAAQLLPLGHDTANPPTPSSATRAPATQSAELASTGGWLERSGNGTTRAFAGSSNKGHDPLHPLHQDRELPHVVGEGPKSDLLTEAAGAWASDGHHGSRSMVTEEVESNISSGTGNAFVVKKCQVRR